MNNYSFTFIFVLFPAVPAEPLPAAVGGWILQAASSGPVAASSSGHRLF
jgi:hypothetical protein